VSRLDTQVRDAGHPASSSYLFFTLLIGSSLIDSSVLSGPRVFTFMRLLCVESQACCKA